MSTILRASSLTDSLAEALRKEIISGTVQAGTRLTEAWVAARFDVARPTAKAGLDRLTNEGLLRRGPHKSAIVPKLGADDIRDIYFSREPVESLVVQTLTERGFVPPAAERALGLMTIAAEGGRHTDHTEADVAFHRALVRAVGSDRTTRMHDLVMGEAQLCIAQVRRSSLVDLTALTAEHAAILDGIRSGDVARAVDALRADLHTCCDALLADLRSRTVVS